MSHRVHDHPNLIFSAGTQVVILRDVVGRNSEILQLHREFEQAFEQTSLPERPNYEVANQFLISARRAALGEALP